VIALRASSALSAVMVMLVCVGLVACRRLHVPDAPPVPASTEQGNPGKLYAVLINGGGTKEHNYRSHLLHLQHLTSLLLAAGVPTERVTIFSSDGQDPAPDVAVRPHALHPKLWLVEGTAATAWVGPTLQYENASVPPFELRPATAAQLDAWFAEAAGWLRPGDTLLVFVTDHGEKNDQDLDQNSIVLWGEQQHLRVEEFGRFLRRLHPEVRVVLFMSQCFSGAFARLMSSADGADEVPPGNVCGYFASTKDRPAYGCYPENLGKDNVGHAFHMIRGWAMERSLVRAHEVTLVADDTPDVPFRTSDQFLEHLLRRHAANTGQTFEEVVDGFLTRAWERKAKWEHSVRLLDRIGSAYGMFSARTLAELKAQTASLPDIAHQLRNVSRSWRGAWHDANAANWQRFLESHPRWRDRLSRLEPKDLTIEQRIALANELLPELWSFASTRSDVAARLQRLHRNTRKSAAASYRMEVRLAALLRMQTLLARVAGMEYLETVGTEREREAFAALGRCEEIELPDRELPAPGVRVAKQFPRYDDEVQAVRSSLPAWMGIQFRAPSEELVRRHNLRPGAAAVITVYPNSPAQAAGLQQGDIVLGPPGNPFEERGQVRSWIMMARVGEPLSLEILRGEQRETLTLVPTAYPLRWPSLPGPPKIGELAPPVDLVPYRGEVPRLGEGQAYVLFFWATWCAPCKASLPELAAFESERRTPVVAITDESKANIDRFFQTYSGPFPSRIATDEFRKAFVAFGVSGTPTFVLVDGEGRVRAVHTGYDATRGLPFEGWAWKR